MTPTNGRAEYYLKIIGVLICILIGLLSYLTVTAIEQNQNSHAEIMMRISDLDNKLNTTMDKLPIPHVHLNNGNGTVRRAIP